MPGQVAQTAAVLAEILAGTTDLPLGVMNIFAESGSEGAALLVESPDVPTISSREAQGPVRPSAPSAGTG